MTKVFISESRDLSEKALEKLECLCRAEVESVCVN